MHTLTALLRVMTSLVSVASSTVRGYMVLLVKAALAPLISRAKTHMTATSKSSG